MLKKPLPCGALISESDGQWTKPISPSFSSLKHTHTHTHTQTKYVTLRRMRQGLNIIHQLPTALCLCTCTSLHLCPYRSQHVDLKPCTTLAITIEQLL